jgi:hypothetical protein
MMSVKKGNIKICKFLIDNGALPFINTPNHVNIKFLCILCICIIVYFSIYELIVNINDMYKWIMLI